MISLVSTILNDKESLTKLLTDLRNQSRFPDEMIVVDGGSTDGTWELLQSISPSLPFPLHPLRIDGANVSRGRNEAIQAARGEWIISTDFGCRLDPQWIEKLAEPYERDPSLQIVTGSWRIDKNDIQSDAAWAEWALALGKIGMIATPTSLASTRSIAFQKSIWLEFGKYPEDLSLAGDDALFSLWMVASKKRIAAAPEAICTWHRFSKLSSYWKEARRNFLGCGEAIFFLNFGIKTGFMTLLELTTLLALLLFLHPIILLLFPLIWSKRIIRWSDALQFLMHEEKWSYMKSIRLLPTIIAFDLGTRWIGIRGYWQGFIQGFWKCKACRQQIQRLGIPRW